VSGPTEGERTPEGFRCGLVTFLGRPNVGKSSLANALLGERIAAVSDKPQTTRNAVRCILTSERFQIVLVDTPGLHVPRHVLGEAMMRQAREALMGVDLVCVVVDARDRKLSEEDRVVEETLRAVPVPKVLVVNKVDLLADKKDVFKAIELHQGFGPDEVVPASAVTGINLDLLVERIAAHLPEGAPLYDPEDLTDATERFVAAELIREQILRLTREEVPHGVAVKIEEYRTPDEYPELPKAYIRAEIVVERPGQKGILLGAGGSMIKAIGTSARKELESRIGHRVRLELWVKVKPNWRKNAAELKRMGFAL
jgi:GTP-binding protein Era